MDICVLAYELGQADEPLSPDTTAGELLADTWLPFWPLWSASEESGRVAQALCATLPLVTCEEARLN